MNVLALDCSTDVLAVAVGRGRAARPEPSKHPYRDAEGHAALSGVVTLEVDLGYRHAERVMDAVEFCLAEAGLRKDELDLLACASGPGSFTGLRIAMSTVKGMSLALGKPFVAVPTLDAVARDWEGACPVVVPVLDAKRARFYFAAYLHGTRVAGPFDGGVESMVRCVDAYPEALFVGRDASLLEETVGARAGFRLARGHERAPTRALLELARETFERDGPAAEDASPIYIRPSDAEERAGGQE